MKPREFLHAQAGWGDHSLMEIGKMNGRYKVFTTYWLNGEVYEAPSINSFDDIELARAERDEVLRDGIEDEQDGRIPVSDLISVEIRERVFKRVTGE